MTEQTAKQLAHETLDELVDPKFLAALVDAEQKGATWIFDPQHAGVVALVRTPGAREAMVIVYTDDEDFENDDEALAAFLGYIPGL